MSTLSPENRQKRLDDLYEYGKSKGTLTYKEIMDRLMELESLGNEPESISFIPINEGKRGLSRLPHSRIPALPVTQDFFSQRVEGLRFSLVRNMRT